MKTMKIFSGITVPFLLLLFVACSSDDTPTVQVPTVTFNKTNYSSMFYTSGQSDAPTVSWNGNQGTFSLGSTIKGVSVNSTTGLISWTKELPLGTNDIQLIAKNSAGQATINLSVENKFKANFTGAYNSNPNSTVVTANFKMDFKEDGTMQAFDGGAGGSPTTSGTWTMAGNTITSKYTYNGTSFITVVTDLTYNSTEAYIKGLWYLGTDTSGAGSGYLRLDLE